MTTPPPDAARPLAGITVVDFSRYLPGPFCTLQLDWLGANVHAIERPPLGDPMRTLAPLDDAGQSFLYQGLRRNATVELVELSTAEGRKYVEELCAKADVVVEGFRPGVAARLGIDAKRLRAQRPELVHCSISGWGQTGPWDRVPGHDASYLAATGILAASGTAAPIPPIQIADLAAGSLAATAICAALVQVARSGIGASLDIAIAEAALAWSLPLVGAAVDEASGDATVDLLRGEAACYRTYQCADGRYIAVCAIEPPFFARLCELLSVSQLVNQQYVLTRSAQQQLSAQLAARFATRTAAQWHDLLAGDETACGIVATLSEAHDNAQFTARGAWEPLASKPPTQVPTSPFVISGAR